MHPVKLDENFPSEAQEVLSAAGFDASSVWDQQLQGKPDHEIAKICAAENRAIVTLDTDFANIMAYPPGKYAGIIVFRMNNQSRKSVLKRLKDLMQQIPAEPIRGQLWIVEDARIRVWDGSN